MMRSVMPRVLLSLALITIPRAAIAHCEIPCGIYDDQMRLDMIAEDITTIEKSMKQVIELSAQKDKNYNQIVRWVTNKENHADKIQHVVSQYFMTQRIKPVEPKDTTAYKAYVKKLSLLHEMLIYAMKGSRRPTWRM